MSNSVIDPAAAATEIAIPVPGATLPGMLHLRADAAGVIVFAHGSGSSRFSRRNQHVAQLLFAAGLGTLLFDLLTEDECRSEVAAGDLRFDIPLLARRLTAVIDWLSDHHPEFPIGLFGASTGAAAALSAAAQRPHRVAALVSRGGRPDLAGASLAAVRSPTLLIVCSWDIEVMALNRRAAQELVCVHRTDIVHGASHLFEEPGKLDEVARLAASWFLAHLSPSR